LANGRRARSCTPSGAHGWDVTSIIEWGNSRRKPTATTATLLIGAAAAGAADSFQRSASDRPKTHKPHNTRPAAAASTRLSAFAVGAVRPQCRANEGRVAFNVCGDDATAVAADAGNSRADAVFTTMAPRPTGTWIE
jgi:hypothetical protein